MTFFNYNAGIPATNNDPSVDQPNMQTNTNSINGIFPVDHFGFNNNLGGWHNVIHMPRQLSPPPAVTSPSPGAGSLYTMIPSGGTDAQLYYTSPGASVTQLTGAGSTALITGKSTTFTITNTYQTILTIPADCIGYLYINIPGAGNGTYFVNFFSISGVAYTDYDYQAPTTSPRFSSVFSGLNLQVRLFNVSAIPSCSYKYIYWSV